MQRLLEYLSDSVCIVNETGEIQSISQKLKQDLGWQKGDIIAHWSTMPIRLNEVVQGTAYSISSKDGQKYEATIYSEKILEEGGNGYYLLFKYEQIEDMQTKWIKTWLNELEKEVCIKDMDRKVVYCNEAYAQMWGKTKEEIIGKLSVDVIPVEYYKRFSAREDKVCQSKERCIQIEVVKQHDQEKYYQVICEPIFDEIGVIQGIGCMANDVTAPRKIEEKAREAFEHFDYVVQEEEGIEIRCVSEFLREELEDILLEYTCADRLNIWVYYPEDRSLKACFNKQDDAWVLRGQSGLKIEQEWIDKYMNGEIEPVQSLDKAPIDENVRPILKQQGYQYAVQYPIRCGDQFWGLVSMLFKDYPSKQVIRNTSVIDMCNYIGYIIKRYMLLQELKQEFQKRIDTEKQLRAYLETSADILVKVDKPGDFLEVNPEVTEVLGWTPEEFVNQKWMDYAHPKDLEYIKRQNEDINQKAKKAEIINRYRHKNGTYRWIQWRWMNFKLGETSYITGRDITEQKKLENKKMKIQKLLQLDELRKEFFANISHELRTPLAVITATHQMIADDIEERHYKKLNQNANRLLKLVNNLIDITKIDAGYYKIEKGNYNIIQLVEEPTLSLVDYAKYKDIGVVFDTESEEEIITCDPNGIERVMLNLLSNAIKYNHQGGKIEVMITLEPHFIIVSVKDNGVGISEDQIPFVFERFIQVDNIMTRKCEGSGIGLSLVKSIVEMHGGEVGLKSEQGETCFWFKLPRQLDEELQSQVLDDLWIEHQSERFKVEFSDIYL